MASEDSNDGSLNASETSNRSAGKVHRWERIASAVLGGLFLLLGLRERSLGGALKAIVGGLLLYRGVSGHSRLYRALGVSTASEGQESKMVAEEIDIERSITIGKSADELSQFWRDADNLTRIFDSFADVESAGENRHRWSVHGPLDQSMSWETELVEDRPGEVLRWESVDGAPVDNEVSVRFRPAPADRGTEVTLTIRFSPPGGALGTTAMERLDFVSSSLVSTALSRFKSLIETGEIPTLERNPSARGSGDLM